MLTKRSSGRIACKVLLLRVTHHLRLLKHRLAHLVLLLVEIVLGHLRLVHVSRLHLDHLARLGLVHVARMSWSHVDGLSLHHYGLRS